MKTIRLSFIALALMAIFACNNQQSNKSENSNISDTIQTSEEKDSARSVEQKPCETIVREILISSARYKQITSGLDALVKENGGQSFGISLEGSPYPSDNAVLKSKTFDFTVYEMYPDRQLNTARFSFNPQNKQLYEYDVVHDKLNPIAYDRNLLSQYDALCN